MGSEGVPAAQDALLRRMYEIFSTDERESFMERCLAPEVDWPNVLDGVRLHGREAVRAYWARQFAAGHPRVRLEGLRPDADGEAVVAPSGPGCATRRATGGWRRRSSTCTGSTGTGW